MATFIELEKHDPSKSRIYQLHQTQLMNGNNERNMRKLVEILGGIDQILSDYLKPDSNMILSNDQLQAIENIIESKPSETNVADDKQSIVYTFNKSNTFLHSIFGLQRGNKILNLIFNKLLWIIMALANVMAYIFSVMLEFDSFPILICIMLMLIGNVIVLIFILLSVNRNLFNRSIKHFVFWFKTLTVIQTLTITTIIELVYEKEELWSTGYGIVLTFCMRLFGILCVIIFSSIDGYAASRGFKFIFGLGMSLLYTKIAVYATFNAKLVPAEIQISSALNISLRSIQASGYRVLSIFLWRQTILTMIKKDKCVNIRHSPSIKWIESQRYHRYSKEDNVPNPNHYRSLNESVNP